MPPSLSASNRVSIALLQDGRDSDAVVVLVEALRLAAQVVSSDETNDLSGLQKQIQIDDVIVQSVALDGGREAVTERFGQQSLSTFDRAFIVVAAADQPQVVNLHAITILFNLALTFHRLGLIMGRQQHLNKALALYKKAILAYHSFEPQVQVHLGAIVLASLMNQGSIYHDALADQAATSECYTQFVAALGIFDEYLRFEERGIFRAEKLRLALSHYIMAATA